PARDHREDRRAPRVGGPRQARRAEPGAGGRDGARPRTGGGGARRRGGLKLGGFPRCPEAPGDRTIGATGKVGREPAMPTFIIERTVPGASQLSEEQLREIARTSNGVVEALGVPYRWLHSYVAGDKIYCVHETENADIV